MLNKSIKTVLAFCISFAFFYSFAQTQLPIFSQEKFSRVKIIADNNALKIIAQAGVCVDHGEHKLNTWLIVELSQSEIATVRSLGYEVEILVNDVTEFYKNQNNSNTKISSPELLSTSCNTGCSAYPQPQNFNFGSVGGFYTIQELLNNLDSMSAKYPNLITVKQSIGSSTTVEGRTIYYVKISDNPNVDENEPEILYNSLHHAREPESVSQLIFYMWYLLENYTTDSVVNYLVNHNELFFIPMVNPDGYNYNCLANPTGGGLWRKNRRVNGDGTFGVDLNRNYSYLWGYDNIGSSNISSSDTYRGPSAASESETQLMKNFINAHQFKISINNHCYSDVLIYPFGYSNNLLTPDSSQFTKYAQLMTKCSGFAFGTPNQTVGYTGNGTIDDWLYADTATVLRNKILSFTPEAGAVADGFWPSQTRIVPIAQNTMAQNIYAAKLIANYADIHSLDKLFLSSQNFYANFNFVRIGMETGNFTVSIVPITTNIISVGPPVNFLNPALLQNKIDSIFISLNSVSPGDLISYLIGVNNGAYTEYDTVSRIFGLPIIAFTDNCNTILPAWVSTSWGVSTSQFLSANGSLTESVSGNYPNNATRTITTVNYIDLTNALAAKLTFYAKWLIEVGYDYIQVQASTDGVVYTPLCGKYTKNGKYNQDLNQPVYDGFQYNWIQEEISLNEYVGQSIKLRLKLKSDGGTNYDGFYFEDALVEKIINVSTELSSINSYPEIKLYPNPASEKLFINFETSHVKTFFVCDITGKIIFLGSFTNKINEINLSELSNGIYFLKIIDDAKTPIVKKFTVVKN